MFGGDQAASARPFGRWATRIRTLSRRVLGTPRSFDSWQGVLVPAYGRSVTAASSLKRSLLRAPASPRTICSSSRTAPQTQRWPQYRHWPVRLKCPSRNSSARLKSNPRGDDPERRFGLRAWCRRIGQAFSGKTRLRDGYLGSWIERGQPGGNAGFGSDGRLRRYFLNYSREIRVRDLIGSFVSETSTVARCVSTLYRAALVIRKRRRFY